ncbi:MAG TPA: tetratricopeptide repeat protein [Pirellulales bacterium]|jgi:Flp pilus assembly protein TadD
MSNLEHSASRSAAISRPSSLRGVFPLPAWAAMLAGTLLLTAVVWLEYGGIVHAPLICDDYATLDVNPSILKLWPVISFSGEETPLNPSPETPVSARPLTNLTFAINYHFGRLDTAGYHIVNTCIHVLAALVLWAVVRRTLLLEYFAGRFAHVAGLLAFGSALVWAVHPLNTESVAYITQRTEALMGLFYLATLYACIRYWTGASRSTRVIWLVLATLAALAGALSKEVIASVPAVALLYERTFIAGTFRHALRKSWPLYVGLVLCWLPMIVINSNGPRTPAAGFHLGLPGYVWWFTQAKVLLLYLKLSFWPWPLVLHYEMPYIETFADAWPWVVPVALLIIATLILVWRRSGVGFVALSMIAALSPTLLIPCVPEIVAERRMYVSLAMLVPLVIVGFYTVLQRIFRPSARNTPSGTNHEAISRGPLAIWIVGTTALTIVFTMVGIHRLSAYNNAVGLLQDTIKNQPDDVSILINLGIEQAKVGDIEDAMQSFDHAAHLFSDSPLLNYKLNQEEHKLEYSLGLACEQLGRPREAMGHYKKAVQLRPQYVAARYNLGLLLQEAGLLQAAMDQYEEAVRIKPSFAQAHCNLGALLASAGRIDEAILHLEEGARLDPEAGTYINLVDAYVQTGRREDAIRAAEQAISVAEEDGQQEMAEQIGAWLQRFRADETRP